MVITDGVFPMDGDVAKLDEIVALAERFLTCGVVSHCSTILLASPRRSARPQG